MSPAQPPSNAACDQAPTEERTWFLWYNSGKTDSGWHREKDAEMEAEQQEITSLFDLLAWCCGPSGYNAKSFSVSQNGIISWASWSCDPPFLVTPEEVRGLSLIQDGHVIEGAQLLVDEHDKRAEAKLKELWQQLDAS